MEQGYSESLVRSIRVAAEIMTSRAGFRRTTLAVMDAHKANFEHIGNPRFTIADLRSVVDEIERRLKLHAAGARTIKAADVFNHATYLAAAALQLAELGTPEYPYAREATGHPSINTQDELPLK